MTKTLKHPKSGLTVTVPDDAADFYLKHGWAVPGAVEKQSEGEPADVAIPDGDPAKAWKVGELTAYAKREGIDLGEATKKDDVFAAITEARAAKAEGSAPDGGGQTESDTE